MPGHLYADDLVLCGESGEELKVIAGCFVEMWRRRGLKVSEDRSRWGGGIGYEIRVDWARLEQVS